MNISAEDREVFLSTVSESWAKKEDMYRAIMRNEVRFLSTDKKNTDKSAFKIVFVFEITNLLVGYQQGFLISCIFCNGN